MRLVFDHFASSVKGNFPALRFAFLFGALAYVVYVAAWITWNQFVPRMPIYAFFISAYPWSMVWHNWQHGLVGALSWPIRDAISILVVAIGFGFNCAFILAMIRFVWPPTHNTSVERDASPQSGSRPSL